MDYLGRSARIWRMGMKKDILQEIEEDQLTWYGHVMWTEYCRTARQVAEWNPQAKRRSSEADQWIYESMGLGKYAEQEPMGWLFRQSALEG
jgi:hypothetical protein